MIFWKSINISKKYWSQPKISRILSGILDPRILSFTSSENIPQNGGEGRLCKMITIDRISKSYSYLIISVKHTQTISSFCSFLLKIKSFKFVKCVGNCFFYALLYMQIRAKSIQEQEDDFQLRANIAWHAC